MKYDLTPSEQRPLVWYGFLAVTCAGLAIFGLWIAALVLPRLAPKRSGCPSYVAIDYVRPTRNAAEAEARARYGRAYRDAICRGVRPPPKP